MNYTQWMNPPGWVYGISYIISALVFCACMKKRLTGWRRRGVQVLLGAALLCHMILTDGVPQALFLPCMAFALLLLFALIWSNCDIAVLDAGYYSAQVFILGEFCASMECQLYFFYVSAGGETDIGMRGFLLLTAVYAVLYMLIFFLMKRLLGQDIGLRITRKELLSAGIIAAAVYGLSNLSYVTVNTPFSGQLPGEIFNIHTLVDLGGVALLWAYHMLLSEMTLKLERDNMESILDMQYANYQISEKSVDMVNQKYHDLKHQIALLKAEFGSKEAMEYLDRMQNEIEIYEAQNKTGNKILDTVLTSKSIYCQGKGIRLTCVADGTALGFMDVMDISALFGNALDNAIESVSRIPEPERRLIHVTVAKQKGFLRIRVENCYEGELVFENGLPKTTKKEKNYHGFGIRSIQSTARKYNGSVTIEAKDGWFELRVLIPVEEKQTDG